VDLVEVALRNITARTETKLDDQLVPLVRKSLRVFVVVVFSLFIAENVFGANIGTWLAGLGIAGLAVSLAAQDSIKNVFGSITIILDQPFQQGDVINFTGTLGTIEEIGFRSTRLRTHQGTLVTIPNSKLTDTPVENITARPNIRRMFSITITYDTPLAKIEQAVQIVRDILAQPDIQSAFNMEKFPPRVYFDELNADSLNIKVFYWFHPAVYWDYLEHAQRFNLRLMQRFEEAGIDFAFPSRTLYLAGDSKRLLEVGMRQLEQN
jgi:MscS family membrane protein